MQSKQVVKWGTLVLLLVSMSVAAIPGTADEPQTQPSAITCGDVADCTLPGPAVEVVNHGAGAAIRGRSVSARIGVLGIGQPGVRGTSGNGTGVEANSTYNYGLKATSTSGYAVFGASTNFRGGYLRSGGDSHPDLVLAANSAAADNGTLSSEPSDANSDLVFYSNDQVHIYLDYDVNTADENLAVYDSWGGGPVFEVQEHGNVFIKEDLFLSQNTTIGVLGATAGDHQDMELRSHDDIYAELDNNNDDSNECFIIRQGDNTVITEFCEAKGMISVGSQAVAVETSSGTRELYAMGSPGLWFEDFGSAALVDGQATVTIDPLFAETVNLDTEYHVFIQVYGNADVYVTDRSPVQFEVHLREGDPNVEFSYRIVAKRLGYESQRLEEANLTPTEGEEP